MKHIIRQTLVNKSQLFFSVHMYIHQHPSSQTIDLFLRLHCNDSALYGTAYHMETSAVELDSTAAAQHSRNKFDVTLTARGLCVSRQMASVSPSLGFLVL